MPQDDPGRLHVLLPSPLLGPSVWRPVAGLLSAEGHDVLVGPVPRPVRTPDDVSRAWLAALPEDRELVLVPHSGAGAYVPRLVSERRVGAVVFADAVLPPSSGRVPLAPPGMLAFLEERADAEGVLPPWTRWWDEADVTAVLPDPALRATVEREEERLPLAYFQVDLPAPAGWDARPAAYLAFGDTYADERAHAQRRGWPVRTLPLEHLAPLTDPDPVAAALAELLELLG